MFRQTLARRVYTGIPYLTHEKVQLIRDDPVCGGKNRQTQTETLLSLSTSPRQPAFFYHVSQPWGAVLQAVMPWSVSAQSSYQLLSAQTFVSRHFCWVALNTLEMKRQQDASVKPSWCVYFPERADMQIKKSSCQSFFFLFRVVSSNISFRVEVEAGMFFFQNDQAQKCQGLPRAMMWHRGIGEAECLPQSVSSQQFAGRGANKAGLEECRGGALILEKASWLAWILLRGMLSILSWPQALLCVRG